MENVKKYVIGCLIVLFVCVLPIGVVVYGRVSGRKTLENLGTMEIVSGAVRLIPPDKTVQITEIEELTNYLSDVVIYEKDNSYREYAGQAVIFTLTMSDGTQTEIMAYNPFLVINGVGYRTKYEPCEALSSFANRLLEEENAQIIIDEPVD